MKTYLDCWIAVAEALFSQALAGEPVLAETQPAALAGNAFGFAATLFGEEEGRFAVLLEGAILELPLVGEGVDQKAGWGELLREVADAAAAELRAKTGKRCRVGKFEETAGEESSVSRAFELRSAGHVWAVLVHDQVRAASATEPAAPPDPLPAVPAGSHPGIDLLLDV